LTQILYTQEEYDELKEKEEIVKEIYKHKEPHMTVDEFNNMMKKVEEYKDSISVDSIVTTTITQNISTPSSIIPYIEPPSKKETSAELDERALKILSENPMEFLLSEIHKIVPGNQLISRMLIIGFMSMHPKIDIKLHQLITGASGRGKSYEIHQCSNILHPIYKIPFEHISPKALNHYCEDDGSGGCTEDGTPIPGIIKNKLLYLDDIEESDLPILKILGNNDGKEPSGLSVANHKLIKYNWDGYPLTICSKVSLPENDEDGQIRSRYLIYGIEESPEHTKQITDKMSLKKSCLSPPKDDKIDPVCIRITHHCLANTAINSIKSRKPIPYPINIEPRNLNFYLAMCQGYALLNHKNRKIHNGTLIIDQADIDYINKLWEEISVYNTVSLTTLENRILSTLKPVTAPRSRDQTIPGMKELGFGSQPTISAALDKLESLQIIAHIGNRPKAYYLL